MKPADVGSYVNYFVERKNGDSADNDPELVPPMVGESEVIFTTVKTVPVRGRSSVFTQKSPSPQKVKGQRSSDGAKEYKLALHAAPMSIVRCSTFPLYDHCPMTPKSQLPCLVE